MTDTRYGTSFVETEVILAAQEIAMEDDTEEAETYLRNRIEAMLPGERETLRQGIEVLWNALRKQDAVLITRIPW